MICHEKLHLAQGLESGPSLSQGCLGVMRAKRKYCPLVDIFRGAGVEGNLGRGNLLEKRGGKQVKELQEEEGVYLWAFWSPLMMHLGVSTVKTVKGWWVRGCPLAYAQGGAEHCIQTLPEQRTCPLLLSSEASAAVWNSIWVHFSAYSFATSIKKKFKQELCTQLHEKATVALDLSSLFRCCWGCILSNADTALLPDWAILGLWLNIILLKLLLLILNWLDGDSFLGLPQE